MDKDLFNNSFFLEFAKTEIFLSLNINEEKRFFIGCPISIFILSILFPESKWIFFIIFSKVTFDLFIIYFSKFFIILINIDFCIK